MGYFRNREHEPIRVRKLNLLEMRVATVEAGGGGGGGAILDIDGGDASNTGTPYIELDGGSA